MPRPTVTVEQLIAELDAALRRFSEEYEGLSLRERVLRLAELVERDRAMNTAVVRASGCDAKGGRERLRLYFTAHVGVVLDAVELEVVAGISEYARRVRELRVEDGFRIITGNSNDPEEGLNLRPTEYMLIRPEADLESAHRWALANRIRNEKGLSAQARILKFMHANVGKVVTSEELQYVSKVKEFGRRTRELRTEQGFLVATHFTGRPDLRQGEYILESELRVMEPHDRHIPEAVQKAVYERDANTCRICGWSRTEWTRADPRFLELHHIEEHADGGENVTDNLLVLCNVCHDDVHAGRVSLPTVIAPPGETAPFL